MLRKDNVKVKIAIGFRLGDLVQDFEAETHLILTKHEYFVK